MTQKNGLEIKKSDAGSRVALIAGGVRGIGKSLTLTLARRGWRVAACYRNNREAASVLEAELNAGGKHALFMRSDVSKPENAAALVRRVESEYAWARSPTSCAILLE